MTGPLRNGLWDAIDSLLRRMELSSFSMLRAASGAPSPAVEFLERLWVDFLRAARDQFAAIDDPVGWVRQWFYAAPWNGVYDLVEYVANSRGDTEFEEGCNRAFARERAAYRLVGGHVTPLTEDEQLDAIDDALHATTDIDSVHEHIATALARLADRPEPDCRNAMKEAISAVESMANIVAGTSGCTLTDALKTIEKKKVLGLHPALNKAWQQIYGYTSEEGGVRHGLKGDSNVGLADATYMVVMCSAFVSYLEHLASKAGIELGSPESSDVG
jgi:hypothetical protein